jgi:uncharacterized phage infection (PIP) family protein YhgE
MKVEHVVVANCNFLKRINPKRQNDPLARRQTTLNEGSAAFAQKQETPNEGSAALAQKQETPNEGSAAFAQKQETLNEGSDEWRMELAPES